LGGIQAGYNWQVNRWLAGLESDLDWSAIKGGGISNFQIGQAPANFVANESIKWFGTVRARLGWLPIDNILLYGTGGLAYGRVDASAVVNSVFDVSVASAQFSFICSSGPNCFVGNTSQTLWGWTAGFGGEFAISSNVSLKAEYLYTNLGHINVDSIAAVAPVAGSAPSSFAANFGNVVFSVVRAGLNYKF
jgi:outer membrane immunogenic protein